MRSFCPFPYYISKEEKGGIWEMSFEKDQTAYTLLSDVLLLFWRFAKIRGAVKQILLGSGKVDFHLPMEAIFYHRAFFLFYLNNRIPMAITDNMCNANPK